MNLNLWGDNHFRAFRYFCSSWTYTACRPRLLCIKGTLPVLILFFSRAANKLCALSGWRVPLGSCLANMAIVINRRMNSLVKCNSSSADNCLFVWTAWMIPWSMECLFAIVLRKRSCVHVHMHTTGDGRDFQPSKCDDALMYVEPTSSSYHSFSKARYLCRV